MSQTSLINTKIYYDSTEAKSGIPRLLKEIKVETISKNLQNFGADYLILSKEFRIGIERKEVNDFITTIVGEGTHTINNQMYKLSTHFNRAILLLEGDLMRAISNRDVSRNFIFAVMAGIIIKRSDRGCKGAVSIIQTDTIFDTALLIKSLHKRIKRGDMIRLPKLEPIRFDTNNYSMALLSAIPGVGHSRAKLSMKEFKTLKNVFNATKKELISIKGIGKETVNNLNNILNNVDGENEK